MEVFSILSQGSFVFCMFPNFYQFFVLEIYYGTSFSYRSRFLDFDSYKVQDMLLASSFLLVYVYHLLICISKMATPGRLQFSYDLYRRYHS